MEGCVKDFEFSFPTQIIFGADAEEKIGALSQKYGHRAMIIYGSERIRNNGLYDRLAAKLKEYGVISLPFGGIAENPRLIKVDEGIDLVRNNEIDLLLAVGGGSVIDTAKAISLGSYYPGDVWDLYEQKAKATEVLPIGVVLTMAATASEANGVSVIWNEEQNRKCALTDARVCPKFALMNPELTYTVPARQTAAGSLDIFAHAFERYIVRSQEGVLRDHLCESIMQTVIEELPVVLADPASKEGRSELMWTATMAHSNMIGFEGDYACHAVSHIFTELFGLSHGEALAILMPAWCCMMSSREPEFMKKFFSHVWHAEGGDDEALLWDGVKRFYRFISSCGLATTLKEAGFINVDTDRVTDKVLQGETQFIGGGFQKLYRQDVKNLIELCL